MVKNEKLKNQILKWAKQYAKRNEYKLNSDSEILDIVISGLTENLEKHGAMYCPCRIISDDIEQNKKIICPCIYHKNEIKQHGSCHCMLFYSFQSVSTL